jgi:probable F420-dependent oxidoreductase
MNIGVVFPQTEIGNDPSVIRDYAQTAEGMGYSHILAYDHVLGASIKDRPDWRGPYTSDTPFHEPFVLFGYMASITERIGFTTGVIILPQRQTALVAKQAAQVDLLSGGRLRLGVGIGWNEVEYVALGEEFSNRGRRLEEQIELLRRLWTEPVVDFNGKWHRVPEAGINPLPVQRPIPIWIGGGLDERVLDRIGRMADGWMPQYPPDDRMRQAIERIHASAQQAGREPNSIGIEARVSLSQGNADDWRQRIEAWRELGAEYVSINTMGMGLSGREHIERIEQAKGELGMQEKGG